jgi:hypothetical protein
MVCRLAERSVLTDLPTKAAATGLGDSPWLAMVFREMYGRRRSSTAGCKPPDERVTAECVTPVSATLSDAAACTARLLHERDTRHVGDPA